MKLLVTGGTGFIGSAFIRKASQYGSLDITVVDSLTYSGDRERIDAEEDHMDFEQIDITDYDSLAAQFSAVKPEAVVHFAAETHVDRSILYPEHFITTNVLGTTNLLRLSLQHDVKKFIHISTDEVYGELPSGSNEKFTEESPLLPNSPYSASKASADMFVRAFMRTYGLNVVTVRPSNTYGPWQYPEKLIPLAIANVLQNRKIPVYGRGENIRTWLYVDDCADAIFTIFEKGRGGECYNIGSDEEITNKEVLASILSLLGVGHEFMEYVADRPGHDFRYALDTKKIEKELGWKASIPFRDGIERTVTWFREHQFWLLEKKSLVDGFMRELRTEFERRNSAGGGR
ncbi:MAG: dTDP-glucose 4,6-dehydratase [Candidatus Xenobiia bacterium LiM19]